MLLVDFDLEAPGLHTFDALQPKKPQPGILEFVDDYVASHAAPDVRDYVYEAVGVGQKTGRLWGMPAGRCDRAYQSKLARLDWKGLYAKYEGYLLFEDLKAQWQSAFEPDYVLIDSRTGHTDVQGICTRQLPDAVVVLFFPNKQNLDGLEGAVADIRAEAKAPRKKKIKLFFVMSNVPDLDDEEQILKQRQSDFRTKLRFDALTAIIHRYDSLTLLNQAIFTRERPRSRLAKEYRKLRDAIVEDNLEDREGAIEFLQRALRRPRRMRALPEGEEFGESCRRIAETHAKDGEVLFLLGVVKARQGSSDEALSLYDLALRTSTVPAEHYPALLLERGDIRCRKQDIEGAREDVLQSLSVPHPGFLDVGRAVRLLREVDPSTLGLLGQSPAIDRLPFPEKISVIRELSRARVGLRASVEFLRSILEDSSNTVKDQQVAKDELSLAYIGLGRFEDAMNLLRPSLEDPHDIANTFNYAMASWGATGKPESAIFTRVLKRAASDEAEGQSANRHQCIAIALWTTDAIDEASKQLQSAEKVVARVRFPEFSCWRYLMASPKEFLDDCGSIRRLMQGERIQPAFIEEAKDLKAPTVS